MVYPGGILQNKVIHSSLHGSSHFGSDPGTNSQEDLLNKNQNLEQEDEDADDKEEEEETPDNSLESLARLLLVDSTETGS